MQSSTAMRFFIPDPRQQFIFFFLTAIVLCTPWKTRASDCTTLDGIRVNPVRYPEFTVLKGLGAKIDLRSPQGLEKLDVALDVLIAKSLKQAAEKDAAEQAGRAYIEPKDFISKKVRRGLEEMKVLSKVARFNLHDQPDAFVHIAELDRAFASNWRSPIPVRASLTEIPRYIIELLDNPIGRGERDTPATNIASDLQPGQDSSLLNPPDSTFWIQPKDIASKDLYLGFNRSALPDMGTTPCKYDEPKTSRGTHAGFEVKCGVTKIKVKFGSETKAEPFASRILWALGYNVDPADYVPRVEVQYDRKILSEFNSRQNESTQITAAGKVFTTVGLQKYLNPMDFITGAIMKDGTRISVQKLSSSLFKRPGAKAEQDRNNYVTDFESQISSLEFQEANIQVKDEDSISLGSWDWAELDHSSRRELRGLGVIAAWLNWYDTRWDNLKLKLVTVDGKPQLRHLLSDVGSVLGVASSFVIMRGMKPDQFPSRFTRPSDLSAQSPKVHIETFQTIEDNPAMKAMNIDDARWGGRLVMGLSAGQLVQAMSASGFTPQEIETVAQKLESRREHMSRDFGL